MQPTMADFVLGHCLLEQGLNREPVLPHSPPWQTLTRILTIPFMPGCLKKNSSKYPLRICDTMCNLEMREPNSSGKMLLLCFDFIQTGALLKREMVFLLVGP